LPVESVSLSTAGTTLSERFSGRSSGRGVCRVAAAAVWTKAAGRAVGTGATKAWAVAGGWSLPAASFSLAPSRASRAAIWSLAGPWAAAEATATAGCAVSAAGGV
jgi:hypothetical protein